MATAQDTREAYIKVCMEKGVDINNEVMFLINRMEELNEHGEPSPHIMRLHGNKRNDQNEMYRRRIDDNELEIFSMLFTGNTYLVGIDLGYNLITDEGAKLIGKLLEETPSLETLILSYNDIGVSGATVIAKGIQMNETLTCLKMDGNKFGRVGGLAIAGALQVNTTLEELDITNTEQDTQSLIALATVLKSNCHLKKLVIGRPLLHSKQEDTTIHFARLLEVNRSIKEIHLRNHGMVNFGVEQIVNHVMDNMTLLHLDVSCNQLSRDGMESLAKYLKSNPPLRILNVGYNRAEDDGAIVLSNALSRGNINLETLVIRNNSLTGKGLCALAKSLTLNTTLTQLYVWGNELDTPACQAFRGLLTGVIPRLAPNDTDIKSYVVDGVPRLAQVACPY
ncbi:leucine-rich repeat-containing protein 34-like [Clytia hemisphaerica]|uniref:Leucine-rich repeat-containing protein 34 n=1 Tax=Clytia hemisphaerica TaxID=252671 RepID=A0A7M5XC23_9CNID